MTPQDLMKSRYETIGTGKEHYPKSPWQVGDILVVESDGELRGVTTGFVASKSIVKEVEAKKFPHLFREMNWWEQRELEDLPQYVKHRNEVRKVLEYKLSEDIPECLVTLEEPFEDYDSERFMIKKCTPATEEEYNIFINSKQQP